MKAIYAILAVVAITALCFFFSCRKSLDDKIKESYNYETDSISLEDYEELAQEYAKDHNGDTTGFHRYVYDLFMDNYWNVKGIPQAPGAGAALPKKVRVYLDNSASMMGYMVPGNKEVLTNDFTKIISLGIGDFYSGYTIAAYYVNKPVAGKGASLREVSFDDMTSMLTHKNIAKGDAFTMEVLLDSIISTSIADTLHASISFLVTDGIISGTNSELSKDRKFNLQNKDELKRRIKNVMLKANKNDYAVAIYPLNAKFDGIYHKYDNFTENLKNANRPFYLIAIGNKALVREYNDRKGRELETIDGKSLLMIDNVGSLIPNIVNANVEDSSDGVMNVVPDEDAVKGGYANLKFNYPLDRFPDYMRDFSALKEGLKIKVGGKEIDNDLYSMNADQTILTVPVKIEQGDYKVTVTLSSELPEWVETITSEDDSSIKTNPAEMGKTFLFEEFVEGIERGVYNLSNSEIRKAEFTIDWSSGKTN